MSNHRILKAATDAIINEFNKMEDVEVNNNVVKKVSYNLIILFNILKEGM